MICLRRIKLIILLFFCYCPMAKISGDCFNIIFSENGSIEFTRAGLSLQFLREVSVYDLFIYSNSYDYGMEYINNTSKMIYLSKCFYFIKENELQIAI